MSDVYTWRNGHLQRCKAFTGAAAKPSYSHSEWFAWSREARLERGRETRKRIYEVLRDEDVLLEPGNHEPVAEWLIEAMEKAARINRPVYVKPGLTASPNFASVYRQQYGFTSAMRWANFRPALLKVTYRPRSTRKPWSLQVIDIKSTHPRAVEADKVSHFLFARNERSLTPLVQVHLQDQFRILAYRHLLAQIVEDIKRDDYARQDFPLLRRLAISHICALWRYTGCYSTTCYHDECILNGKIDAAKLTYHLEISVEHNKRWIENLLFNEVPTRVGVPCQHN